MLLEIFKVVLPFIGGGLAGAFLNEWFRRKNSRLQSIPLIERVNRLVDPKLEGFTLARVAGDAGVQRLEEVKNVREYQLTLRNTASVHLQDVEIQFEFPTEDIVGWASRPALSKTAPVSVEPVVTIPWKKGFRWRIPHLPSSDSIEFGFKAVNPLTADYEVALYKSERVVIERSKGEPAGKERRREALARIELVVTFATLTALVSGTLALISVGSESKVTLVNEGGCMLTIQSTYERFPPGRSTTWPWGGGPWRVFDTVTNIGTQPCVVQSDALWALPRMAAPGSGLSQEVYSASKPRLVDRDLDVGLDNPTSKAKVQLYEGAAPK
jgi:hypothetical protein